MTAQKMLVLIGIILTFFSNPIFAGRPQPEEKNSLVLDKRLVNSVKLERYSSKAILAQIKKQQKKSNGEFYQVVFNCKTENCELSEINLPLAE